MHNKRAGKPLPSPLVSFWGPSMSASISRLATPDDEKAIDDAVCKAGRLVLHTQWSGAANATRTHDLYLIEAKGRTECVLGLFIGPSAVARIHVFALRGGWSVDEGLSILLPLVRRTLRDRHVETLGFVGPEQWLIGALVRAGFRQTNTIVTLQKTDLRVPDPGNPRVTVRQATQSDFSAILEIDRAAFDILWWNTADTLAQWLSDPAYFVIAEWNGRVVGYQCASLNGRHGHVSRIAVHPEYHGQRIGARLLSEAMAFFERERVFGVTLNTQQDNKEGCRLYEWFGFRVLGKEAQVLVLDV